ncbi:MAG: hypothetical protein HYS12_29270 [Planctomycetes bacterium]|nr:hypothetical protein [Planctomycetota bacterium]
MDTGKVLDREEYIEQVYFFRTLRERVAENLATQEVLERIDQEILATTRLPYAIQFLKAEVKHTGLLSSGFEKLPHYFTPFQAFVVRNTEDEVRRFSLETALTVLEREAEYRAGQPTPAGLFVYEFEVICRNRLGYDGLTSMSADPLFDAHWRDYLDLVRRQVGLVDFADLVYIRSENYVSEQRRQAPDYEPPLPPLFGTKEGRIARANHGRDPLYLFAALQRQLGYPVVPRPRPREDAGVKIETLQAKIRDLETRLKLIEGELRGQVDLTQFGKPELLTDSEDDE